MPRALRPALLLLAACGPDTAMVTDSAGGTSTTQVDASTSTTTGPGPTTGPDPTTGEPEPCGCDDPQVFDGNLDVDGLAALSGACIGEVTGQLRISGVTDPVVLHPLRGLRRVHQLQVFDNPGLVDLAPLACLEEVPDRLSIQKNPALVDVGALTRVRVARFVDFKGLPIAALPSFAPDYHGFRTLSLERLPALADLGPVAAWPSTITEDGAVGVSLRELPLLTSITALAGPIGAPTLDEPVVLELHDLPALTSLSGLEAVRNTYVTLSRLPQITSLAPLSALEQAKYVYLDDMSGLSSLEGLHNLRTAHAVRLTGMPTLTSLAGLRALEIATYLQLGGCDEDDGLDGLTDLPGLDALTETSLWLSILRNANLTALSGAPQLKKADWVDLVDNPKLTADAVAAFDAQVDAAQICFGGEVECGCLGELPEALTGCPEQWSGGSSVLVAGEDGPLTGTTAFFGWTSSAPRYHYLNLVLVDTAADLEVAKDDGLWQLSETGGPKLVLVEYSSIRYQDVLGEHTSTARLMRHGELATDVDVALSIDARLGDWTTVNPADPPRLVGKFTIADPNAATTVEGPFDAVYCPQFSQFLAE